MIQKILTVFESVGTWVYASDRRAAVVVVGYAGIIIALAGIG